MGFKTRCTFTFWC